MRQNIGPRVTSRTALLIATTFCATLIAAAAVQASTASFSRTEIDGAFTVGNIAGSVTWTDCDTPGCQWIPFVSLQPELPSYACRGDEAIDSDPNTTVIYNGGGQAANGAVTFDLANVQTSGRRRVCASVYETRKEQDPLCVAQAPILGMDPATCPLVNRYYPHALATATLQPSAPPATATPAATSTPGPSPSTSPAPTPAPTSAPTPAKSPPGRKTHSCGTVAGGIALYKLMARGLTCQSAKRIGRAWRFHLGRMGCRTARKCVVRKFTCRAQGKIDGSFPVLCRQGARTVSWRVATD